LHWLRWRPCGQARLGAVPTVAIACEGAALRRLTPAIAVAAVVVEATATGSCSRVGLAAAAVLPVAAKLAAAAGAPSASCVDGGPAAAHRRSRVNALAALTAHLAAMVRYVLCTGTVVIEN